VRTLPPEAYNKGMSTFTDVFGSSRRYLAGCLFSLVVSGLAGCQAPVAQWPVTNGGCVDGRCVTTVSTLVSVTIGQPTVSETRSPLFAIDSDGTTTDGVEIVTTSVGVDGTVVSTTSSTLRTCDPAGWCTEYFDTPHETSVVVAG
jgi:hypothetical protein